MRGWIAGALATLLSTLVALAAVEIGLRLFGDVRNVGPAFSQFDATYGKRLKPDATIRRVTPEFTMTLTTNAQGFRGPPLPASLAGAIVFTGDSFTMGYGVNDGEEFPALVRAALAPDGPPVINGGIGNTGNAHSLIWLEDELKGEAIGQLVLQLTGNDFANNRDERLFALTDDGRLERLPPRPPGARRNLQVLIEAVPGLADLHLLGLLRQAATAIAAPEATASGATTAGPDDALTFALVDAILALAEAQAWPVFGLSVDIEGERAARLQEIFAARDVPLLFVPSKADRPDLYFEIDGHWRPEGHRFVADLVLRQLARP